MNKNLVFFFILFWSIASMKGQQSNDYLSTNYKIDFTGKLIEPFNVKLYLDKIDKKNYNLSATIELQDESYVISPFSKDEIYGHFGISINKSNHLLVDPQLLEMPLSIEEFDPIINMPVKFVRENTTYRKSLKVINENDFEVKGIIEFVLEPQCIPYDVNFTIAQKSGKTTLVKTSTTISKEYKR